MPFIINENEHGNVKRLVNCLNDRVSQFCDIRLYHIKPKKFGCRRQSCKFYYF